MPPDLRRLQRAVNRPHKLCTIGRRRSALSRRTQCLLTVVVYKLSVNIPHKLWTIDRRRSALSRRTQCLLTVVVYKLSVNRPHKL